MHQQPQPWRPLARPPTCFTFACSGSSPSSHSLFWLFAADLILSATPAVCGYPPPHNALPLLTPIVYPQAACPSPSPHASDPPSHAPREQPHHLAPCTRSRFPVSFLTQPTEPGNPQELNLIAQRYRYPPEESAVAIPARLVS